jgi:LacI family transcriptional regulator
VAKTIRDVAKEAGVSIATVSRVINRTTKVRQETLNRVVKAAEKLNFYPDQGARSMVSKKTKSVGLLVPTLLNEYWASFCESVQRALLKEGYSVFLGTLDGASEDYFEKLLRSVLERKMDGLIFGTQRPLHSEKPGPDSNIPEQDTYFLKHVTAMLKHGHLPVISFGEQMPGFSSVWGDHYQGGVLAAEHLKSLGHGEIAYIGGDPFHRKEQDPRERGFRDSLQKNGTALNEHLARYVPFSLENGAAAAGSLLETGKRFTALFCWNDVLAAGALNLLLDRGVRVPEDVSVIGFDDISLARATRPALTTIHQPIAAMGKSTVDLLLDALRSGAEFVPRNITLAMELVERKSCDRPGIRRERKGVDGKTKKHALTV